MPLSTGVKAIDDMMGGGIPVGAPSLIFGIPNLGKTWLCFQLSCMCIRDPKNGGLGRPVLYLDTESFFTSDVLDLFWNYFEKRFPDIKGKKDMIEVKRISDIFELGEVFNIHYTIKQEGDRVSVISKFPTDRQGVLASHGHSDLKDTLQNSDWQKTSDIWKAFEKKKYGLMVIDSLTVPIKSSMTSATQNLPARTSLITQLLGVLYPIAIQFSASIVVTDHITRNPMEKTYIYGIGEPWGGQNVTYYIKNQYGLYYALKEDREKAGMDSQRLRRVERHRMPGKEKTMVTVILQKDLGYNDWLLGGAKPAEDIPTEAMS